MYVIQSGTLFEVNNGTLVEFKSPFAEDFYEEDRRSWGSESWKYKQGDNNDPETSLVPRSMLWGGRGQGRQPAQAKFAAVFGTRERLYYVLELSTSCGLFYYDLAQKLETRVFHRTDFKPQGLFVDENDYSILTTINNPDGAVHLALYDAEGKRERIITSGDCRDENPYRLGSDIYYQSSGLARDAGGAVAAVGPSAICKLNMDTGDVDEILSSEKHDYLLPHVAADGTLYCIRAPYQAGPVYPLKNRLLDIVLFPWRLCVAIFAFLNVFSMFFAKTPLTTAGGPNSKKVDLSGRILHNRMVNMRQTWKQEGRKVAVSKDWKLMKFVAGQLSEIASNALWFDLDSEGRPVYTDGYALYDSSGKSAVDTDEMLTCLAARRGPIEIAPA